MRQKRRNLLLGAAIALGTIFLLLAGALSRGISRNLLNRVVATFTGHITVNFIRNGMQGYSYFEDRDKIMGIIKERVKGIESVEESVQVMPGLPAMENG